MGKLSAIFLNGKIKNSIHYLNDKRKGLSTFYFRNGNEKFSINHTNDGKSIFNIEKSLRKFGENITVAIKNSNINYIKVYIIMPTYKDNFVDKNYTVRLVGQLLSQSYNGDTLDEQLTLFEENYTSHTETYKNYTINEFETFYQAILKNFLDNSYHFKDKIVSLQRKEHATCVSFMKN